MDIVFISVIPIFILFRMESRRIYKSIVEKTEPRMCQIISANATNVTHVKHVMITMRKKIKRKS